MGYAKARNGVVLRFKYPENQRPSECDSSLLRTIINANVLPTFQMGEEIPIVASYNMILRHKYTQVYRRIAKQNPDGDTPSFLCSYWDEEPAVRLDGRGNTLLDLLVIRQYEEALRKLLDDGNVSQEHLKKQNLRGETALHEAARHDNVGIVKLLLEKEEKLNSLFRCPVPMCNCKDCSKNHRSYNLVSIRNVSGETAHFLAAACGKWDIFFTIQRYNYDDCIPPGNDGCTVLHAAIMGENYLAATKLLHLYPELAQIYNKCGESALNLLASSPSSFSSNFPYTTTMTKASFVPLQMLKVMFFRSVPDIYTFRTTFREGDEEDPERLPWIKPLDDTRQKNILAVALAKILLEEEVDWSRYTYCADKDHDQFETSHKALSNPLIQAIEMGIPELVKEILWYFPDAANSFDKDGRNVFHYAAEHKGGDIYEMLKDSVINKDRMLLDVDNGGSTILHYATKTKLATSFPVGVSKLMAWDIFWYQRMKGDCLPHLLLVRNNDGSTADDLLMKNYNNIREAAVKAVNEMNQGLMVVAALIATVSFTAVFTLPGGFDQSEGRPLLFNGKNRHIHDLNLFLSYVGLTFFASLIALGTLLSIQLSRFHLEDLYFTLPVKYSIAMACLLLSSCSIFSTFLQALVLEDFMPPYYYASLVIGCIIMGLLYVDPIYHVLSYIAEVLRYSRRL